MKKFAVLALATLVAAPSAGFAHTNQERSTNQLGKIERGRQTGEITWREGLKLRKEQKDIAKLERDMSADGRLNKRERRILHKLQNKADQHITAEATDRWHRAWWLPRFGR